MADNTNAFRSKLPAFHRTLMRWYKAHGRTHLPWRNTEDAYRIYVSEIMLQQTQVRTVLERYYTPFLKRFPTLAALARAKREEVMKAWEGLGYYTRAGNLHAAAQQCRGALPDTVEGLMALPGVGRNTANAVACFAFGVPVPVMEANVKRVLARVFALTKADEKTLWQKAEQLLDRKHPFDYNQAMMDVGSLVCTKRNPRCSECPLSALCKGKTLPESYPARKETKKIPVRRRIIAVFCDDEDRYFLARRETRFLKGLYGFMEYEAGAKSVRFMQKSYALPPARLLGAVRQSYSHFTLEAKVYLLPVGAGPTRAGVLRRVTLQEMQRLPLSRADQKIAGMLRQHH